MELTRIKDQIQEFWMNLERGKKITLIALIIGFLLFSLLTYFFTTRVIWSPLFTNLKLDDAGEIVEKLKESNINYQLVDSGTTILVSSDKVYETRLMMGREGLPRTGGVGFRDLFTSSNLTSTDWERQVKYNLALQEDLTHTIQSLFEVREAKVNIVAAKQSLFLDPSASSGATAGILLDIRSGYQLSPDQVKGIVHLVSHSVEGLKPENVTVIDKHGRILSAEAVSTPYQHVSNQMATQVVFQKDLENSISSLLQQVFGIGNVVVKVAANLNFDERILEMRLFEPVVDDSGILRSISEINEQYIGTGQQSSGVPGVESNVPGYVSQNGEGLTEYEKSEIIKNFEINETFEKLVIAPGTIKKLSVAVVVNSELNEEQKTRISEIISGAIGAESGRDEITVDGFLFDESWKENWSTTPPQRDYGQYIPYAIGLLAALLVGSMLLKSSRKRSTNNIEEFAIQQTAATSSIQEIDTDNLPQSLVKKELSKFATKKPEGFAQLISTWLNEDQR